MKKLLIKRKRIFQKNKDKLKIYKNNYSFNLWEFIL